MRVNAWVVAVGCLATWLGMPVCHAKDKTAVGTTTAAPGQAAAEHSASYSGVTLRGGAPPLIKTPPEGLQYVTWTGFRAEEQGTEVFLQLTGPVEYRLRQRGHRVEVILKGAQVYLKNNLRKMITRHFPGPVDYFRLRELKGDKLMLEAKLSRRSKAHVSLESQPPYSYLVVAFPPKASRHK